MTEIANGTQATGRIFLSLKLSPRAMMVCDAALCLAIEIDTEQGCSANGVRAHGLLACIRNWYKLPPPLSTSLDRQDAGTLAQALQTYMQHLQEGSFLRKEAEQLSFVLDDFIIAPKVSAPKVSAPKAVLSDIRAEDPTEAKLRAQRDDNLREFIRVWETIQRFSVRQRAGAK